MVMPYIYTMKYYTAVKKNEIINFVGKLILQEKTKIQTQRNKYHIISHTGGSYL